MPRTWGYGVGPALGEAYAGARPSPWAAQRNRQPQIGSGHNLQIMKYAYKTRRTDIEGALKRLDKLTNEEAQMTTAQVLKATRNIDESVRGVDDRAAIDDGVAASVDEKVKAVDDKVTGVDGA